MGVSPSSARWSPSLQARSSLLISSTAASPDCDPFGIANYTAAKPLYILAACRERFLASSPPTRGGGIYETILTSIAAAGLVATLATAQPQPRYTVKDLGTLPGGTFSAASQGNTDNGLVGGVATVSGGAQHAVVWYKGRIVDIATSGLGGPNSITIGLNARGQAVGAA